MRRGKIMGQKMKEVDSRGKVIGQFGIGKIDNVYANAARIQDISYAKTKKFYNFTK